MATVLVTGAGRGLGHELARQYADDGWTVLATCRDARGDAALRGLLGEVEIFDLDVTNAESIAALRDALGARPIDVLINNAGINPSQDGGLDTVDESMWRRVMAVNAFAPLRMVEVFRRNIAAGDLRRIVAISSEWASIGRNESPGPLAYRASKAALNASMRCVANELGPQSITVIMVDPGWIDSDMGGPNADVRTEDSAAAIRELVDRMTPEMNGRFYHHRGRELDW